MGRKIEKQGERKNVYLAKETIDAIKEMSKIEGLNFSQTIDVAVTQFRESENPQIALEKAQQEIKIKEKELDDLKLEEKRLRELVKGIETWKKNMLVKRKDALRIIVRKIANSEMEEAERMAKTWGRILHCPYVELLNEATAIVERGI